MNARTARRSRLMSSRPLWRATPRLSSAGPDARAHRRPCPALQGRRGPAALLSRAQGDALVVRKVPARQSVTLLEQGLHRFPDRDHVRMLMRPAETALDPGEDLDVGEPAVSAAEDQRLLVRHESELAERMPVTTEQLDEAILRIRPDPICADHRFLSHVPNN